MNRRSFLGGVAGAAAVPGMAIAAPSSESIVWRPKCGNRECGFEMRPVVIPLDEVVKIGNQCPRCLHVLDTSGLAEQFKAAKR